MGVLGSIVISMIINIIAVILAGMGIIDPVVGALVHNLSSILIVLNSSTLIKFKYLYYLIFTTLKLLSTKKNEPT